MSDKTTRIISLVLLGLISAMLVMSGIMKLLNRPEVVEGLTKAGMGKYITMLGIIELAAVAMLWYPATRKWGFGFLTAYLGGAIATELAGGQPPGAAVFMVLLWVGSYLRDKGTFVVS